MSVCYLRGHNQQNKKKPKASGSYDVYRFDMEGYAHSFFYVDGEHEYPEMECLIFLGEQIRSGQYLADNPLLSDHFSDSWWIGPILHVRYFVLFTFTFVLSRKSDRHAVVFTTLREKMSHTRESQTSWRDTLAKLHTGKISRINLLLLNTNTRYYADIRRIRRTLPVKYLLLGQKRSDTTPGMASPQPGWQTSWYILCGAACAPLGKWLLGDTQKKEGPNNSFIYGSHPVPKFAHTQNNTALIWKDVILKENEYKAKAGDQQWYKFEADNEYQDKWDDTFHIDNWEARYTKLKKIQKIQTGLKEKKYVK